MILLSIHRPRPSIEIFTLASRTASVKSAPVNREP